MSDLTLSRTTIVNTYQLNELSWATGFLFPLVHTSEEFSANATILIDLNRLLAGLKIAQARHWLGYIWLGFLLMREHESIYRMFYSSISPFSPSNIKARIEDGLPTAVQVLLWNLATM